MPTLKAFECWIRGYDEPSVVWAKTASKARYSCWLDLSDCCPDLQLVNITVRRAPSHDMDFPADPDTMSDLDEHDRGVILHAYGGGSHIKPDRWGYRNHYCIDPTDERLNRLVREGLFRGPCGVDEKGDTPGWVGGFFYLTDRGKEVARALIGEREATYEPVEEGS